jgi:predicted Zn-dependent peptidase
MLSLESPASRMYRLAGGEVFGERYRTLDEIVAEIGALSEEAVVAAASEFFAPERQTVTWLGPAAAD